MGVKYNIGWNEMKSNKLLLPLFYDKVNLRVEGTKKRKRKLGFALGLRIDEKNFAIKSKACIMIIRKSIADYALFAIMYKKKFPRRIIYQQNKSDSNRISIFSSLFFP
jgi:hypothetical protein